MKGRMSGARVGSIARRMTALCLGIPLAGCASMTRDVDAYYRQMATNYQEAIDQAKQDEAKIESRARVLAVTGDEAKARKYQRELEKIRSWEEHCAREKKRFEKAAAWLESHFDISQPATAGASISAASPETAPSEHQDATGGPAIKSPTD